VKCYYVIREDIDYSSDRLFKIAVKSFPLITNNREDWLNNPISETYMMLNMRFLYDLERKLIEDGVFFRWIEDYNTTIGILIEPTKDHEIVKKYLDDCLTLEEYASWRQKQMNELTLERKKRESNTTK
jgi:hypothetical protein